MDIRITPTRLTGAVTPPPSKSQAHRALIAAALAGSTDRIHNLADSQDIAATKRCMAALMDKPDDMPLLDCGESGSTLRFLIPVTLTLRGGGRFTGRGRLMERPQGPYFDIFREKGIFFEQKDGFLTIRGALTPGVYRLPGNVSSQFVTGLLYALPLLPGDSEIVLTSPLESREYVTMTIDALKKFGISTENQNFKCFSVHGSQKYLPCDFTIEADWSQAGFWYAANFIGNAISILGLDPDSAQGDRVIKDLCLQWRSEIDVSQCPDLLPPLAVMAAARTGTTRFINAARLRMKESDRIASVAAMMAALGGKVEEFSDALTVHGIPAFTGGTVDGANDHRIVMAAAIAATRCTGPVTIRGAEAVGKSYPTFFDDYKTLGGVLDVL